MVLGISKSRLCGGFLLLAAASLASGCATRIDQRGNRPDEEVVAKIQPGIDDKYHVTELLGSPSAVTTFSDKVWYYISKRTETVAFFDPSVVEQQVVEIQFDDNNVVKRVRLYDESESQDIELVDRETPTEGNETSLFQELFGNIGRFNPKGDDAPSPY